MQGNDGEKRTGSRLKGTNSSRENKSTGKGLEKGPTKVVRIGKIVQGPPNNSRKVTGKKNTRGYGKGKNQKNLQISLRKRN